MSAPTPAPKPTPGALRVAESLALQGIIHKLNTDEAAAIIDRETGHAGMLAALELGLSMQGPGDVWSVRPDKMKAFKDAARTAIARAKGGTP